MHREHSYILTAQFFSAKGLRVKSIDLQGTIIVSLLAKRWLFAFPHMKMKERTKRLARMGKALSHQMKASKIPRIEM